MTDPIADLLTRIRNAISARQRTVSIPFSKMKHKLSQLLLKDKWIEEINIEEATPVRLIKITLSYSERGEPVLKHLQRLSRPGRRLYVREDKLPVVQGGFGTAIISTTKGLMTNRQAKAQGLGGEVICEVY